MTDDAPTPTLDGVLQALADPVRLGMVQRLASSDEDMPCGGLYENVAKSTASYHFAMLRASGLIEQYVEGNRKMNHLRVDEVEATLPGVLTSILAAGSRG
jgi:DNA-binding transcriptional ArsR family regulator